MANDPDRSAGNKRESENFSIHSFWTDTWNGRIYVMGEEENAP